MFPTLIVIAPIEGSDIAFAKVSSGESPWNVFRNCLLHPHRKRTPAFTQSPNSPMPDFSNAQSPNSASAPTGRGESSRTSRRNDDLKDRLAAALEECLVLRSKNDSNVQILKVERTKSKLEQDFKNDRETAEST